VDADLRALEKEVVVPVEVSEEDLALTAAWFAAVMPWRREVSTRIGLLSASAICWRSFSRVMEETTCAGTSTP